MHCSPVKSPCPRALLAVGRFEALGGYPWDRRRLQAKTVDFLQYVTVGALCDPTADIPFASLSDITRCLGPVFTAAARVDPMGSVVVGAASLVAAAGYVTPRAGDSHPALRGYRPAPRLG